MNEHIVYGIIGFVLGGLVGGYLAGRMCAREYKKRITELEQQNDALCAEARKTAEKGLAEREKGLREEEARYDRNFEELRSRAKVRGRVPSTKEIEELSESYRSDAFNAHFADRVAPDDSDDVGESEDEDDCSGPLYEDADPGDDLDDEDVSESVRLIEKKRFEEDSQVMDIGHYTYYQEDGVLVDDSTQEVERDQVGTIGVEGMEKIADTEDDFLYVVNDIDDMLYEVAVDHNMSYYRDVLGF